MPTYSTRLHCQSPPGGAGGHAARAAVQAGRLTTGGRTRRPVGHPAEESWFDPFTHFVGEQSEQFDRGFLDRAREIGDDFVQMWEWLTEAVGLGDADGAFGKAWEAFGGAALELMKIAGKLIVVTNPAGWLHPSRDEYEQELKDLGLKIGEELKKGYQEAYAKGGVARCAGRLAADIIAIALEVLLTKGAGKAANATKLQKLLPPKLRRGVDKLKQERIESGGPDGAGGFRRAVLRRRINKALNSADPGLRMEGKVAERYLEDVVNFQTKRAPGHDPVTGATRPVPHPNPQKREKGKVLSTIELDVELKNSILEVTVGTGGKFEQVKDRINSLRGNPAGKKIIVFDAESKFKSAAVSQLQSLPNVYVARSWQELDALVNRFGR